MAFRCEQHLRAGKHVFWLSCRLRTRPTCRTASPPRVPRSRRRPAGSLRTMHRPASGSGSASHSASIGRRSAHLPHPRTRHDTQGHVAVRVRHAAADGARPAGRHRHGPQPQHRWRTNLGTCPCHHGHGQYGGLPQEQNGCSDPGLIVDQQTGEVFCFAVWMHGKPGKHNGPAMVRNRVTKSALAPSSWWYVRRTMVARGASQKI